MLIQRLTNWEQTTNTDTNRKEYHGFKKTRERRCEHWKIQSNRIKKVEAEEERTYWMTQRYIIDFPTEILNCRKDLLLNIWR